jgi:predicted transglutaminase-like cysteine proteinase
LILFFSVAVSLVCGSCLAEPAFFAVKSTPYDRQMTRVRPILQTEPSTHNTEVSLRLVNHWIEDLRAIPYGFSQQWKTPRELEREPTADCKGKAVALYEKMRRGGAIKVRLVIGMRTAASHSTHAWLEWTASDGEYILDPTINWAAFRSEDIDRDNYRPFYAYSGNHKFCATAATLVARN